MSSPTTVAGSSPTTVFSPVTAPSGKGFVTIPGGTPGVSTAVPGQPAVPGPQNDGSDFYGLAIAVVVIVGAIFLVRRLVPLRRGGSYTASRRTQPPVPIDSGESDGQSHGSGEAETSDGHSQGEPDAAGHGHGVPGGSDPGHGGTGTADPGHRGT